MIALKGRLEREGSAWKWTGRWCFGTEFVPDKPGARSASMPFCYNWEHPVSPGETLIPAERGVDYDIIMNDTPKDCSPDDNNNEPAIESQDDQELVNNITKPQEESNSPSEEATKVNKQQEEPPVASEGTQVNNESSAEEMKADEHSSQQQDDQPQMPCDSVETSKVQTPAPPVQEATTETQSDKPPPATPRSRTFADKAHPDDPDFADAGTKYSNECPPSGSWQGYFETTVGRKKPQAMPVPESFSLFLNATPASRARACFPDDMMKAVFFPQDSFTFEESEQINTGLFELIGSLDKESGVMHCQRLYYPLPRNKFDLEKRKQSFTSDSVDTSRPARTRQLSWKKRALHEGDEEPQHRRRRSSFSTLSPSSKKKVIDDVSDAPLAPHSDTVTMVAMADSVASAITPVAMKAGGNPLSVASSAKSLVGSSKRTQQTPASRNRNPTQKSSSNVGGTAVVKLPSLNDAAAARWRAAHYLYYQKPQPPSEDGNVANSNNTSSSKALAGQQAKYVIYEGEMYNSQRHGRGVCLYTNGLLYEGEWFQDKEHGAGTILSSDRKRIIYKGDFTYGKIHGAGIYYYYQTPPRRNTSKKPTTAPPTQERVSRYEGEFKEMLRHGNGTYHLPDGSVYSGQFRDNQFCGRGIFTHGLGVLRSSDGFTYDGMWVNNAMDGRGSAVYPGGQAYNGLFSNGRREGRGTIIFTNGAVYEGRFRDDMIDGQGTMKMGRTMVVPDGIDIDNAETSVADDREENEQPNDKDDRKKDFMIPLSFQADMGHIHRKAGFTVMGE